MCICTDKQVEIAVLRLEDFGTDELIAEELEKWEKRIDRLQEKMREIDEAFTVDRAGEKDIPRFIQNWASVLEPETFVADLTLKLEDKYYWYRWVVVSYEKDVRDGKVIFKCGKGEGWRFEYHQSEKNRILYAAFENDEDKPSEYQQRRSELQNRLDTYKKSNTKATDCDNEPGQDVIDDEITQDVAFMLVIVSGSGLHYSGQASAVDGLLPCVQGKDTEDVFDVILFGTAEKDIKSRHCIQPNFSGAGASSGFPFWAVVIGIVCRCCL